MAYINISNTAAMITYSPGCWNDMQEDLRVSNSADCSASFEYNGAFLLVYGYKRAQDPFTAHLDNITLGVPDAVARGRALVNTPANDGPHKVTLQGIFGLSSVRWFDPNARNTTLGTTLNATDESVELEPQADWSSSSDPPYWDLHNPPRNTSTDQAKMSIDFTGIGIIVMGETGPKGGQFEVNLDGVSFNRSAFSGSIHDAILHRSDGLVDGTHSLSLTNIGTNTLRVREAQILIAAPSTTGAASSIIPNHPTPPTVTPSSPSTSSLKKGAIAGIVIGLLAVLGFTALALLWFRRRHNRNKLADTHEKNRVVYGRMCSKCRNEITGDYRLECVMADCPAAVDLHPECGDWNTPERHDHAIHQVPNK